MPTSFKKLWEFWGQANWQLFSKPNTSHGNKLQHSLKCCDAMLFVTDLLSIIRLHGKQNMEMGLMLHAWIYVDANRKGGAHFLCRGRVSMFWSLSLCTLRFRVWFFSWSLPYFCPCFLFQQYLLFASPLIPTSCSLCPHLFSAAPSGDVFRKERNTYTKMRVSYKWISYTSRQT